MKILWPLIALLPAVVVSDYTRGALEDEVIWDTLPGAGNLPANFNMFAGFIDVNEETGKRIFYWFMEAQENPEEAPVVLWTNGGPGCSGFLGLLTEHGPFQVRDGGETLVNNEYSWNKLANMLYVEIPSGVGYSYSDRPADYKTGDEATTLDNLSFINGWMDRFPRYQSNRFFISSESYGGHYMPLLGMQIIEHNKRVEHSGEGERIINFGGFLVGNPFTEYSSNQVGMYEAYWGKQLLPKVVFDEWWSKCVDGGYKGDLEVCQELEARMDELIGNVNPYALDFPVCEDDLNSSSGALGEGRTLPRAQRMHLKAFIDRFASSGKMRTQLTKEVDNGLLDGISAPMLRTSRHVLQSVLKVEGGQRLLAGYEPCAEDFTIPYLNREDVRKALHAPTKEGDGVGSNGYYPWEQCSSRVEYLEEDLLVPMMSYYNSLLDGEHGIKILVFSGDDDAVCATWGTQWWIYDLGYEPSKDSMWETWEVDGQVAGYVTRFEGVDLSFVTVHSAGHEVPAYQPERALKLFEKFLDGSWF